MSSIPNNFNFLGDDTNNHSFFPIQMNQNSKMVRSMFISSDHTNHGNLFSSSPSFTSFQNSHVSSSSFGFQNPYVKNHMMSDNYFPINNHSHLTRVSFTQTITNRYTAIIPTNTLDNAQYGIALAKRAMNSETNIWNRTFSSPITFERKCEILNPKPLNVIYPRQDSAYSQHLDMFSLSSKHNHDQHILQDGRSLKNILNPINRFEKTTEKSDDNNQDDGRTHSLPYEKYGPYTCPKCNGVFDTSQKFAAHMSSHYKTETTEEREQRLRAKNKRKFYKLNYGVHGR
ncbi:PREDICTED: uncharacterized protein LOC104792733 [Camelina sativa]|uniref:Uncharacterized protein LOC104792733 n=1 Tax=Camelina sativa TaxID=90675 RepID=A0ABM1QBE5_CAMSA|nr:PREDICTED: uncharacterized protein LOC104792733 [Camelina sativa]